MQTIKSTGRWLHPTNAIASISVIDYGGRLRSAIMYKVRLIVIDYVRRSCILVSLIASLRNTLYTSKIIVQEAKLSRRIGGLYLSAFAERLLVINHIKREQCHASTLYAHISVDNYKTNCRTKYEKISNIFTFFSI